MLSCREVTRIVSESRERKLNLSEKVSLKMHLAICKACSQFTRQMAFLGDVMREYSGGKNREGD